MSVGVFRSGGYGIYPSLNTLSCNKKLQVEQNFCFWAFYELLLMAFFSCFCGQGENQQGENEIDVWLGKENFVQSYTREDIYKTIKKAKKKLLKVSVNYDGPIEAPIKKDEKIATLKVVYDEELIGEYDLLSSKEVKKVNFLSRLFKSINYLIWGDV